MQKADGKKISTKDTKTPMLVSSLQFTCDIGGRKEKELG